ncbi:2'-5' RNA ligase family protein [Limibacter armeniacum]|uniref:2'-5' RNA ligase family protein n=1 Tax=Limibacter armeniacum TaxID=466084 RepID=UPI002FE5655E
MTIEHLLDHKYREIAHSGISALTSGKEYIDAHLQLPDSDRRMGLTLLVTLEGEVLNHFCAVHQKLQPIEPYQYYYPTSDIHLTVMDLIGAKEDLRLDRKLIQSYMNIFDEVLSQTPSFNVYFKGVAVSNGAVIAKGYYDQPLYQLRNSIRQKAKERKLLLEERYESFTAHATIVRFKDRMRRHGEFINSVKSMEALNMGKFRVKEIEFVYHDWYNIEYKKVLLGKYTLKS